MTQVEPMHLSKQKKKKKNGPKEFDEVESSYKPDKEDSQE